MEYKWMPLSGEYIEENDTIVFKGKGREYIGQAGQKEIGAEFGELLFDKYFSGGTIQAEIEFTELSDRSSCQIIVYYNSDRNYFKVITIGVANAPCMFEYKEFNNGKWNLIGLSGDGRNLKANEKYTMTVNLKGSKLDLSVNGIDVLSGMLPFPIPQSQVGLWCQDYHDIIIHDFKVETVKPKAFIVMQFTSPFNELYHDVIKGVCDEFDVEAIRADDSYESGIIISDIITQINESKLIIADISPNNPNVYYEVGYAHALNKPTILIAEKNTKLPFDVSPFRILLYENSIKGKSKIEEGLRKHLKAILLK